MHTANFSTRMRQNKQFWIFWRLRMAMKRPFPLAKWFAERRTLNDLLGYTPMPSNLDPQTFSPKKMNQNGEFWVTGCEVIRPHRPSKKNFLFFAGLPRTAGQFALLFS